MFFAHSGPTRERWEPLADHLRDVAERAGGFAEAFGGGEEARLAGLLHDLGKYSELFTARLEGKASGLDHWSAGAWAALTQYRQSGIAAALAIQGHHIGLQRGDPDSLATLNPARLAERHPLGLRLTESAPGALLARLGEDGIDLPAIGSPVAPGFPGARQLDVRMLFSALVDADFLETEAHFLRGEDGTKHRRPEGSSLQPAEALRLLEEHVTRLERESAAASDVGLLRSDLFRACLEAGDRPRGLFTLTAPTGAGKTLAMLAFALRHAVRHGLRRVVVAIPFLSILEQTARVYRELFTPVFGDAYVLEHHSLAGTHSGAGQDPGPVDEAGRRAAWLRENWDSPLIVTTSVQILESLFANRPSACRKLHRLAGSVILFDEVQTLPPWLAVPTLAALSRLAERYGASVVFATATQPAFDSLDEKVRPLAATGWQPAEIAGAELRLFERTRRTRVEWEIETPRSWESLADELADLGSALCIVNLKRHAQELAGLLVARGVPGLFHLSTNLCPAHRERVLATVRARLDASEPCLLISTQCIEAGVDVDFPRVLRAFGPLEAIAQAAGRCNRNGRLPEGGLVRVFLPEDACYPGGGYEQAAVVTRMLLNSRGPEGMDLQSQELFRLYYQTFYELTGAGDHRKSKELITAVKDLDFVRIAELYRLIDQDAISVLVPYDLDAYDALKAGLREAGHLTAGWIRRARPHTINLYRPKKDDPVWAFLSPVPLGRGELSEDWFVYLEPSHYDRELLGLTGTTANLWIA
jgi:CRISPR-associated endonuclease/helicase Cas3